MGKTLSRPKGPRRPPKGVSELLDSPGWQKLNSASQPVKGGVKMKLELIDGAGLPPMHLISAVTLETLGTFPRNQDGHTKDAREVLAPGAHAVIMLFSHRWLDPDGGFIDDSNGTKMLALLEFVKWYRSKYPTRELHFWIDYCCIGWEDRKRGIEALPAYVAAATDILCFETPDYENRAWCRLERAVAYAFMFAGEIPWVIKPGFTAEDPPQPVQRRQVRLEDPMNGDVTVLEDKIHIAKLLEVAKRSRASEAWGMSRVLRFGEGGTVITAAEPGRADNAKGD
eukprot:m.204053 g.204053  ORF g.204053 m.204053 type:complete len:283 (+) comp25300_c0_seq1:42-890(+)